MTQYISTKFCYIFLRVPIELQRTILEYVPTKIQSGRKTIMSIINRDQDALKILKDKYNIRYIYVNIVEYNGRDKPIFRILCSENKDDELSFKNFEGNKAMSFRYENKQDWDYWYRNKHNINTIFSKINCR